MRAFVFCCLLTGLAGLLLSEAGCTKTLTCAPNTVFVSFTFSGAARNADSLTLQTCLFDVCKSGNVAHQSGDTAGSVELTFGRYLVGSILTLTVTPTFRGAPLLGPTSWTRTLALGCTALALDIGVSNPDGSSDVVDAEDADGSHDARDAKDAVNAVDAVSCADHTSVTSCGASCKMCDVPAHGSPTCDGTSCGIACNSGYNQCGESGCVPNDTAGCGTSACGPSDATCPGATNAIPTCDGISCGIACNPGYNDCGNGCVANTTVGCGTSCCGPSCTKCPTVLNGTPTCDGTTCGTICNIGYNHSSTAPTPGCILSDTIIYGTSACGPHSQQCPGAPNAIPTCDGTSCSTECKPGYNACGSACVSPYNLNNCGECFNSCQTPINGSVSCKGTPPSCVPGCPSTYNLCSDGVGDYACYDPSSQHFCGAGCTDCSVSGTQCVDGICQ
jgi:hypothetical protein